MTSNEMSGRLAGKAAIVTGGASGIGEGIVRRFREEGATVVIADWNGEAGEDLARELGNGVLSVRTNVLVESDVERVVESTMSAFGKLDIFVNNAGTAGPVGPTSQVTSEDFDALIGVILRGAFFGIKHATRVMIPHSGASIISIASTASVMAGHGAPIYTAAKHGVVGLTKAVAGELAGQGIRANAVSPGKIATPLAAALLMGDPNDTQGLAKYIAADSPLGISGLPVDIGNAVLFLASDEARYITGHNLLVDSGKTVLGGNSPLTNRLNNA